MAFLLAVLTSIFYGVFDFAGGMATRRGPVLAVAAWANMAGLGLALCIATIHHVVVGATVTIADFSWGLISGVAGVAGVVLLLPGTCQGQDGRSGAGVGGHPGVGSLSLRGGAGRASFAGVLAGRPGSHARAVANRPGKEPGGADPPWPFSDLPPV